MNEKNQVILDECKRRSFQINLSKTVRAITPVVTLMDIEQILTAQEGECPDKYCRWSYDLLIEHHKEHHELDNTAQEGEDAPTDNDIPEMDSLCEQYNNGEIGLVALCCRLWNTALTAQEGGWISVEDRLPEQRGEYMVFQNWRSVPLISIRHYYGSKFDKWTTHWQPLPAPPKENTAQEEGEG